MLKPLAPADAQRLRDFLTEAKFTQETFREMPALRELPNYTGNLVFLLERTREPSLLNLLVRLFVTGVAQEKTTISRAIPEPVLRVMLESGMLAQEGDSVSPRVMLTPCDEHVFAADTAARMRSEQSSDAVLWPNPTTRVLQLFSLRAPSRATLDLGAGCGMLGVLAAAHSGRVVATDLNPRAEQFILFNARLNRVDNIESLTGNTFEPVKDRQFDLILANLPYFVTPTSGEMYCENSMELDQYCRRVVREAAQHLTEGGYFQATLEWVQVRGERWQDRLAGWLAGSGCDAWILRRYSRDAVAYAEERIRTTWPPEQAGARLAEFMAYYREREVEEVHGGLLAMRRRSGKSWLRIEEMAADPTEPYGATVLTTFATQDILSAHPTDEELLAMKPRLSPAAQLEQTLRVSGGKWATTSRRLRLTTGVPASLAVEAEVADFLSRCDGSRPLEELTQELAAKVNAGADVVRQQCCAVVRKLAERRLLQIAR
ncbi:MAG TPA: methyltransferase [Bryobacteraceae bacterium]|nr:methyltransferase [Bryobacteraceae bacterium]